MFSIKSVLASFNIWSYLLSHTQTRTRRQACLQKQLVSVLSNDTLACGRAGGQTKESWDNQLYFLSHSHGLLRLNVPVWAMFNLEETSKIGSNVL